jgi:hypothetical protein
MRKAFRSLTNFTSSLFSCLTQPWSRKAATGGKHAERGVPVWNLPTTRADASERIASRTVHKETVCDLSCPVTSFRVWVLCGNYGKYRSVIVKKANKKVHETETKTWQKW